MHKASFGRPAGDNYWELGPSGWLPEVSRVDANFHSYRVVNSLAHYSPRGKA